jgi:hypothetical protein
LTWAACKGRLFLRRHLLLPEAKRRDVDAMLADMNAAEWQRLLANCA